jgi:hypothetical protein
MTLEDLRSRINLRGRFRPNLVSDVRRKHSRLGYVKGEGWKIEIGYQGSDEGQGARMAKRRQLAVKNFFEGGDLCGKSFANLSLEEM